MPSSTTGFVPSAPRAAQLEACFEELAELTGQRNAIDGRIVEIVAEIDGDGLWGATGARSVAALVAWKTGVSPANAKTIATIAHRLTEFPRCTQALREGRLSLDQVGAIAERATTGSDDHYAELATHASVSQLRTAIKLEPPPQPQPAPEPDPDAVSDADVEPKPLPDPADLQPSITTTSDEQYTYWHIKVPHVDAAKVDAALHSRFDGLIAQWKRDHGDHGDTDDTDHKDARVSAGHRCPGWLTRSWTSSTPPGTPRPPAARTQTAPPWSCTSTSTTASPPYTSAHCCRMPIGATWAATPPAKCGSNATANSSAPDAPRG
uniref:DUF222 domain-containing protein n=1 Tax=Mycobacterium sp. (strain MCS) TaxID=164756 RepID=A0A5Q5BIF4_MYCSS